MRKKSQTSGVSLIIVIILLALIGGGIYFLSSKGIISFNKTKLASLTDPSSSLSPVPIPTESPDPVPQEKKLYLGSVNNIPSVFFVNSGTKLYYENGVQKTNENMGQVFNTEGTGQSYDYKNFLNPQKIQISLDGPVQNINSFKLNDSKTYYYISLNIETGANQYPDNLMNEIYQIKAGSLVGIKIWSNKLGSNKYPVRGAAYINQVIEDKYLLMLLGECYACGGHQFTKSLILNLTTKNEKYAEDRGGFIFDLANSSFTYQKLAEVQVPCIEDNPYCANGFYSEMQPKGETYSDKLP